MPIAVTITCQGRRRRTSTGIASRTTNVARAKVAMMVPIVAAAKPRRAPYSGIRNEYRSQPMARMPLTMKVLRRPGMRSKSSTPLPGGAESRSGRGSGRLRSSSRMSASAGNRARTKSAREPELVDRDAGDDRSERAGDREAERQPGEVHRPPLGAAVRPDHAVHRDMHQHEGGAGEGAREVEDLEAG